jgi:hypothetical protein
LPKTRNVKEWGRMETVTGYAMFEVEGGIMFYLGNTYNNAENVIS